MPSCPEVMLSGQRTCSVCLVLGLQRPWDSLSQPLLPHCVSCWQSAGGCGGGWGAVYPHGPCVVSVYRLPSGFSGGECDVLCPLLLARAAWLLGMCGRVSTPTWAEAPERWGLPHSHRELVRTPERRAGRLPVSPPRPVQDAAVQEPGYGPVSPRAWGHFLVLPSQQALSLVPTCPCRSQPGCVQELAPGSSCGPCRPAQDAASWVLRCTYRGSDVTPEVPFPGGGPASGTGWGWEAAVRLFIFLRPLRHLEGGAARLSIRPALCSAGSTSLSRPLLCLSC